MTSAIKPEGAEAKTPGTPIKLLNRDTPIFGKVIWGMGNDKIKNESTEPPLRKKFYLWIYFSNFKNVSY
tara:strand:+ start:2767 stop:2973 length:207 start_codon:yes stop_codon:yes gene_type:complete